MAYTEHHPGVDVRVEVEKPMALPPRVAELQPNASAVMTLGEVEMDALIAEQIVHASDVEIIANNTYPLVIVVPGNASDEFDEVAGLATHRVNRVFIEDSNHSTLGARAEQALKALDLWDAVAPKIVRPEPDAMILAEIIDGTADAAVVFKDCLVSEGGTGSPPKTVRIAGEFPADTYDPIFYRAAPLQTGPQPELAREFISYLVSDAGRKALEDVGLSPVGDIRSGHKGQS